MQWKWPTRRATSGDQRQLQQPASKPVAPGASHGNTAKYSGEHPCHLVLRDAALVEALSLGSEIAHRGAIDILAIAGHGRAL